MASTLIWVSKTNKVPQISTDDMCSGKGFFPATQTWNHTGGCVKDWLTLKRIYLLWHWQPVNVWKDRRHSYRVCVLTTNMTDTPGISKNPCCVHFTLISSACVLSSSTHEPPWQQHCLSECLQTGVVHRLPAISKQPETSRGKQWCNDRRIQRCWVTWDRFKTN